ncbi:hypothetical protein MAR_016628, partial [Mya arenaria]
MPLQTNEHKTTYQGGHGIWWLQFSCPPLLADRCQQTLCSPLAPHQEARICNLLPYGHRNERKQWLFNDIKQHPTARRRCVERTDRGGLGGNILKNRLGSGECPTPGDKNIGAYLVLGQIEETNCIQL